MNHLKPQRRALGFQTLEDRRLLAAQVVVGMPSSSSVAFDQSLMLSLQYDISNPLPETPLLLGLRVHYDSSKLQFVTQTNVLADGLVAVEDRLESVSDNDPATDRVWTASFIDVVNGWPLPTTELPVSLASLQFRALKDAGTTAINLTADTTLGYDFQGTPVVLSVTQPTFVVNSSDDSPTPGELTLRQAMALANAEDDPSIVTFAPSIRNIDVTGSSIAIANDITIRGPRADELTIDAKNIDRLFVVNSGKTVSIGGVTLTGGNSTADGGSILNQGILALDGVRFIANKAAGSGGAISNLGTLTVRNSEFAANQAMVNGGAIHNTTQATIVNSTVSGNSATASGGGIASSGTTVLRNNTIVLNTAGTTGAGIQRSGGTTTIRNTIVLGNTIASAVTNLSGTIETTSSLTSGAVSEVIDTNLAFAGSPTRTHALIATGPAVDGGSTQDALDVDGGALFSDQRGRARIVGANVDIGAFEFSLPPGFTVAPLDPTTLNESGTSSRLSVVLTTPPAGAVVVRVASSDVTEAIPAFATLTFGPGNWNVSQIVPIVGVDDLLDDGDKPSTITLSIVDESSDDAFDDLPSQSFAFTTIDDDENVVQFDFGDAPAPYPVTLANDGARHATGSLFLGVTVDGEVNGTNSAAADSDDNTGGDEDGVFVLASFITSNVATTSSFVVIASGPGKLDGWSDFNNDGDWSDAGEQIFNSVDVVAGENLLSFTIPAGATSGSTGARFRLSTAGGLAPTGAAADGEVEDYLASIVTGSADTLLDIDLPAVPAGNASLVVEGTNLVVRKDDMVLFRAPFASFGELNLNGSPLDDVLQLTILESLATKTLVFDGGLGKDFLELVESGRTLDLTGANITIREIEGIDIRGTGNNRLVISIDTVKAASSSSDTLEVLSNAGDTITFGPGWRADLPRFINGQFTHVISEAATGGTARVEVRNDRFFTNPLNRFDVDRNGSILPLDALRIINALRRVGTGPLTLPTNDAEISTNYFDVSGDNNLTALDALRVINALSRINRGGTAEGEAASPMVDLDAFANRSPDPREVIDIAISEFETPAVATSYGSVQPTKPNLSTVDDWMEELGSEDSDSPTGLDGDWDGKLSAAI